MGLENERLELQRKVLKIGQGLRDSMSNQIIDYNTLNYLLVCIQCNIESSKDLPGRLLCAETQVLALNAFLEELTEQHNEHHERLENFRKQENYGEDPVEKLCYLQEQTLLLEERMGELEEQHREYCKMLQDLTEEKNCAESKLQDLGKVVEENEEELEKLKEEKVGQENKLKVLKKETTDQESKLKELKEDIVRQKKESKELEEKTALRKRELEKLKRKIALVQQELQLLEEQNVKKEQVLEKLEQEFTSKENELAEQLGDLNKKITDEKIKQELDDSLSLTDIIVEIESDSEIEENPKNLFEELNAATKQEKIMANKETQTQKEYQRAIWYMVYFTIPFALTGISLTTIALGEFAEKGWVNNSILLSAGLSLIILPIIYCFVAIKLCEYYIPSNSDLLEKSSSNLTENNINIGECQNAKPLIVQA